DLESAGFQAFSSQWSGPDAASIVGRDRRTGESLGSSVSPLSAEVSCWTDGADASLGVLEASDRLAFERERSSLRLLLLVAPVLLLVVAPQAGSVAALMSAAILCSFIWTWSLARYFPDAAVRFQLLLRLLDCALIGLVLYTTYEVLGTAFAYFDSVYLLTVIAAAATHGRRGALLISAAAALLVLATFLHFAARGALPLYN